MAAQRTTFAKLQRERAKQAKQEAKRAARQGNDPPSARTDDDGPRARKSRGEFLLDGSGRLNPDDLLEAAQALADRHAAGDIDDDEMDEMRQALLERAG